MKKYYEFRKLIGYLVIIIILHPVLEEIITKTLVHPVLSKVESSIVNDIIFFVILLWIIVDLIIAHRKNVFLSWNYIVILLVTTAIYFYYRVSNSVWEFTELYSLKQIKYFDIISIFSVSELLKKLSYKPRDKPSSCSCGFIFDNPISNAKKDSFERVGYAKSICKKIEKTSEDMVAFSIGIIGDWGVGKTSFLELIKENLSEKDNILLDFNPWLNNGANSIIQEFFKILSSKIEEYNSDLSKKIEKYCKLLLQIDNSSINKISKAISYLERTNNVVQIEYQRINTAINKLNKKLIVFIDDLDRLDNNEIIEVIRIIRNTANFGNTVFVAAYDRNYLVNALKSINSYNNEFFLEKIFQIEIPLPEYEIEKIGKKIYELLLPYLNPKDKIEIKNLIFEGRSFIHNSKSIRENSLRTMRDATRFVNSFSLSYSHLEGEIEVKDLFFLEILKLKYPGVYSLLLKQKNSFLTTEIDGGFATSSYIPFYSLKKIEHKSNGSQIDKYNYRIEQFLSENPSLVGIHESNINSIIDILKYMFPDKRDSIIYNKISLLSIANPSGFDRYSHYHLLSSNLSQVDFDRYRKEESKIFLNKMKEWISLGLRNEIKDRFKKIHTFESKEEFEKTIISIFNLARIPENSNINNDYAGYDYHDLKSKIDNYKNKISKELYNDNKAEYINFLKSIFENASSPYTFEMEFIYQILQNIEYDFIIEKEFFENIRIKYLQKYLESIEQLDIRAFQIYNYCDITEYKTTDGHSYTEMNKANPQANELFIQFLKKKDLDNYLLLGTIRKERFDSKRYAVNGGIILKMFETYSNFKSFLFSLEPSKYKYLEEFMNFYEACEKENFEKCIDFNFKEIPIDK